jgi:hypothetical protein
MACINVLVGQCGNQLGATLFNALSREAAGTPEDESYQTNVSTTFFREATKSERRAAARDGHGGGVDLPVPRAVLVDMETKVVGQSLAANAVSKYAFTAGQCVTREEGSANNWACGYFHQGPSRLEAIGEAIRREVEAADSVGVFHVMHSLAGGTGSGVGCLTSDCLRTMFPKAVILHTAVLPYSHGETATQWYNSVLSYSTLHETADGVNLMSNEEVALALEASNQANREGKQGDAPSLHYRSANTRVSLQDINTVMADTLASMLLPSHLMAPLTSSLDARMVTDKDSGSKRYRGNGQESRTSTNYTPSTADVIRPRFLTDVVELVAADPARKFFESSSYPRALGTLSAHLKNARWPHCLNEALRGTSWGRFAARCPQLASNPHVMGAIVPFPTDRYAVVLRGSTALPSVNGSTPSGYDELRTSIHSLAASASFQSVMRAHCPFAGEVDFNTSFMPHGIFAQPTSFHGESAHVSLFHTSQSVGQRIAFATSKAEKMFNERAFLHHYERYGIEDRDMEGALAACWHVARAYNAPEVMMDKAPTDSSDDDHN